MSTDREFPDKFTRRFKELERLGDGGMGSVSKVWDYDRQSRIALKFPDKKAYAGDGRKLFDRECEKLEAVKDGNCAFIVRHIEHGVIDSIPWLGMEYLEGVDALTHVRDPANRTKLNQDEEKSCWTTDELKNLLTFFRQLAQAVAMSHQKGIIHRDIKPQNTIITKNQKGKHVLKLIDYGIAKGRSENISDEFPTEVFITQKGSQRLTKPYASIEQLLDPREATIDFDLFSLGRTYFYLLITKIKRSQEYFYPFLYLSQIKAHLEELELPSALCDLVVGLQQYEPKDRMPKSADEIAVSLWEIGEKLKA